MTRLPDASLWTARSETSFLNNNLKILMPPPGREHSENDDPVQELLSLSNGIMVYSATFSSLFGFQMV